mmetsp:Transcript_35918/g.98917  ORF Transcript_35918/g.98917 Transcript_35918/m.98917 type:complete len:273 (+) Transcript_35918:450-1268(+)
MVLYFFLLPLLLLLLLLRALVVAGAAVLRGMGWAMFALVIQRAGLRSAHRIRAVEKNGGGFRMLRRGKLRPLHRRVVVKCGVERLGVHHALHPADARAEDAQHFHAQVKDLTPCGPRICPRALALLLVEIKPIAMPVEMLGPRLDFLAHIHFHILHLFLEPLEMLVAFLCGQVGIAETGDGLISLSVGVLQGMRPRAHAQVGVVVEHPVAAVKMLSPIQREWRIQGLDRDPKKVVVGDWVNAQVPGVSDELRTRGLQPLQLLVFRLTDEIVH